MAVLPASAAGHARPQHPKVEISAVQYDSPGRDDRSNRSLNKEWVDVTNTTRHTVNLDDWTIEDASGHRVEAHNSHARE
ncbi:lamin tail domain-containing protein [Streptomyces sp. SID12501]|uniref:lamin tail domain-containing protein n=1 Tax=Streptomyces sp. SID12501 TaxID=2706042 RepID=UPI0031BB0B55